MFNKIKMLRDYFEFCYKDTTDYISDKEYENFEYSIKHLILPNLMDIEIDLYGSKQQMFWEEYDLEQRKFFFSIFPFLIDKFLSFYIISYMINTKETTIYSFLDDLKTMKITLNTKKIVYEIIHSTIYVLCFNYNDVNSLLDYIDFTYSDKFWLEFLESKDIIYFENRADDLQKFLISRERTKQRKKEIFLLLCAREFSIESLFYKDKFPLDILINELIRFL